MTRDLDPNSASLSSDYPWGWFRTYILGAQDAMLWSGDMCGQSKFLKTKALSSSLSCFSGHETLEFGTTWAGKQRRLGSRQPWQACQSCLQLVQRLLKRKVSRYLGYCSEFAKTHTSTISWKKMLFNKE